MTDYYSVHLSLKKPVGARKQQMLEALILDAVQPLISDFEMVEVCKQTNEGDVESVYTITRPRSGIATIIKLPSKPFRFTLGRCGTR